MVVDEQDRIGVSTGVSALEPCAAVQHENVLRDSQIAGKKEEKLGDESYS